MLFIYQLFLGKTFWASLTHAFMSIFFMITIYFCPVRFQLTLAQISLFNSLSYFIADLPVRRDTAKIIHHCICAFGCVSGLFLSPETTLFTAKLCGLLEMSGPSWTFLRLRLEKSDEIRLPHWYTKIFAGGVFMITFFLVRFIWFPLVLFNETPPGIPNWLYHSTVTPFHCLNIYWMYLLIRGFFRELYKNVGHEPSSIVLTSKIKRRRCD